MVILELIRLLQKRGLLLAEAIEVVSGMCAYKNHTILAEALETWPYAYLQDVVPVSYTHLLSDEERSSFYVEKEPKKLLKNVKMNYSDETFTYVSEDKGTIKMCIRDSVKAE